MPGAFLGLSPERGQVQKQLCRAARRFPTVGTDTQNPACRPHLSEVGSPPGEMEQGCCKDLKECMHAIPGKGKTGSAEERQVRSEGILNTEDGLAADPTDVSGVRDEKQCGDEERDKGLKPVSHLEAGVLKEKAKQAMCSQPCPGEACLLPSEGSHRA